MDLSFRSSGQGQVEDTGQREQRTEIDVVVVDPHLNERTTYLQDFTSEETQEVGETQYDNNHENVDMEQEMRDRGRQQQRNEFVLPQGGDFADNSSLGQSQSARSRSSDPRDLFTPFDSTDQGSLGQGRQSDSLQLPTTLELAGVGRHGSVYYRAASRSLSQGRSPQRSGAVRRNPSETGRPLLQGDNHPESYLGRHARGDEEAQNMADHGEDRLREPPPLGQDGFGGNGQHQAIPNILQPGSALRRGPGLSPQQSQQLQHPQHPQLNQSGQQRQHPQHQMSQHPSPQHQSLQHQTPQHQQPPRQFQHPPQPQHHQPQQYQHQQHQQVQHQQPQQHQQHQQSQDPQQQQQQQHHQPPQHQQQSQRHQPQQNQQHQPPHHQQQRQPQQHQQHQPPQHQQQRQPQQHQQHQQHQQSQHQPPQQHQEQPKTQQHQQPQQQQQHRLPQPHQQQHQPAAQHAQNPQQRQQPQQQQQQPRQPLHPQQPQQPHGLGRQDAQKPIHDARAPPPSHEPRQPSRATPHAPFNEAYAEPPNGQDGLTRDAPDMSDRNANQGMRDMNAPTPEQSIPPQQQRSQDRNAQDRSQPSSPGAPKAMNNQRQGGGRSSGSQAGMARKTKALGGKGGKKGTGTATATLSSEILLSTLVQQKPMPRVTGKKPGEAKVMFEVLVASTLALGEAVFLPEEFKAAVGKEGGLEGHMGEMLGHGRGLVKMIV